MIYHRGGPGVMGCEGPIGRSRRSRTSPPAAWRRIAASREADGVLCGASPGPVTRSPLVLPLPYLCPPFVFTLWLVGILLLGKVMRVTPTLAGVLPRAALLLVPGSSMAFAAAAHGLRVLHEHAPGSCDHGEEITSGQ